MQETTAPRWLSLDFKYLGHKAESSSGSRRAFTPDPDTQGEWRPWVVFRNALKLRENENTFLSLALNPLKNKKPAHVPASFI